MRAPAFDRDSDLLRTIASLQVVTVYQLAILSGRKPDTLRRQIGGLEKRQLVRAGTVPIDGTSGRPEKILSLTPSGQKLLRDAGFDIPEIANEPLTVVSPQLVRHHLLIGTVRIHLSLMTRTWPEFRARFLVASDSSPASGGNDERVVLVPDAVIGLSHMELGRTLLFFLEADRGTEPLASHGGGDIRQKILNYQVRFQNDEHKRYEQKLQAELKGFRVLFVTDTEARLAALCRVVREAPPSDFIWLTDEGSLSARGIGAPIWVRGGLTDAPRESILGSKMPATLRTPPSAS